MSRILKILVFLACSAAAAFVALFVLAYFTPKSSKIPRCHDNLVQIELCKYDWENDQTNKNPNAIPSWEDLRPYFPVRWSNSIPVCPDGGTYTIGRLNETPRCSIGKGYSHSLQ
jgi:hypothetical protein